MILKDIIANSGVEAVRGRLDRDCSAICSDSRKVTPGSVFIAVKGFASDGHDYIEKSVRSGASVIVYENEDSLAAQLAKISPSNDLEAKSGKISLIENLTLVKVSSSRHALAIIAANFYGNPSEKLSLVGITGTNGKTTTVTLLYNMFMGLGYNCGLLSTIANYVGKKMWETANTTADPITINSLLAQMVEEGCEYCFMEVSSIGVEQERVSGLHFRAGIFSNLTHDHLDYHGTFAEYLRCKKLFFDNLEKDAYAIINVDDKNGPVMVQNTKAKVVTYSCRNMADHTCKVIEESFDGMQLRIDGKETWTRLIGRHNAYNLLAIYTTAVVLGTDPEEALIQISNLSSAKGRLETMRGPRDMAVVIDYAHTPDALENVLSTLKDIAPSRNLVCLFGCGGDRDRTKRPEMAAISEKYADRIFVTSDNSRTENTSDILADIRKGFSPKGLAKAIFIEDRKEAIRSAIMLSPEGSTILLAGKGHETYQILGKEKHHFDEREIVEEVFKQTDVQ